MGGSSPGTIRATDRERDQRNGEDPARPRLTRRCTARALGDQFGVQWSPPLGRRRRRAKGDGKERVHVQAWRTATDRISRLLVGAGRAAVSALAAGRLAGDALELLRRRIVVLTVLAWVPLLVLSVAEGHAWGGGRAAVPLRHRAARPPPAGAAAVDRGGTGRAPAAAPNGAAVPRARPDPGLRAGGVRRSHRLGDAAAQFGLGGGAAHRARLHRRGWIPLADADGSRRAELVRRDGRRDLAADAGRLVAGPA